MRSRSRCSRASSSRTAPSGSSRSRAGSSTAPSSIATTGCRSPVRPSPPRPATGPPHTAEDGSYTLRLRPGHYTLFVNSGSYVEGTADLTRRRRRRRGPRLQPCGADRRARPADGRRERRLRRDDERGRPPRQPRQRRPRLGGPRARPRGRAARPAADRPDDRDLPARLAQADRPRAAAQDRSCRPTSCRPARWRTIITDPSGDSSGSVDATVVRGGSDGSSVMAMSIDFTARTPIDQAVGEIYVDTDQDPSTGIPPSGLAGLPTQDIGAEYLISLFSVHDADPDRARHRPVHVRDHRHRSGLGRRPDDLVRGAARRRSAATTASMDVDLVLGDPVPADGLRARRRARDDRAVHRPALAQRVARVPARRRSAARPTSRSRSGQPTSTPGVYHGLVVFITNAPKQPQVSVEVNLTVNLPDRFRRDRAARSATPTAGTRSRAPRSWSTPPGPAARSTSRRRPTAAGPTGSSGRPGPGRRRSAPPATSPRRPT